MPLHAALYDNEGMPLHAALYDNQFRIEDEGAMMTYSTLLTEENISKLVPLVLEAGTKDATADTFDYCMLCPLWDTMFSVYPAKYRGMLVGTSCIEELLLVRTVMHSNSWMRSSQELFLDLTNLDVTANNTRGNPKSDYPFIIDPPSLHMPFYRIAGSRRFSYVSASVRRDFSIEGTADVVARYYSAETRDDETAAMANQQWNAKTDTLK